MVEGVRRDHAADVTSTAQAAANVQGEFGVPGVDVGLVAGAQATLALCEPARNSEACLIWSLANWRLDGLIGLFAEVRRHRQLCSSAISHPRQNKEGRHGRNWKKRFIYSWVRSLSIHQLGGTIRYYRTAHA